MENKKQLERKIRRAIIDIRNEITDLYMLRETLEDNQRTFLDLVIYRLGELLKELKNGR